MKTRDLLLILSVIVIWGGNFTFIKIGLSYTSPFLFGALRFLPYLFIIFLYKRPNLPFLILVIYAFIYYFCQFSFLFAGIALGLPAGMSSMILQSQAFFTVFLAIIFLKERFRLRSLIGLIVSAFGLMIIALQDNSSVPLIGLMLVLMGGACWAFGNILIKKYPNANVGDLTAWGGVITIIPFLITAIAIDGTEIIVDTIQKADFNLMFAILYVFGPATAFGAVIWGKLIRKYNASSVAPFSLLVPIVGISSAALFLDEHLSMLDLLGSVFVMVGLCINVFGALLFDYIRKNMGRKRTAG